MVRGIDFTAIEFFFDSVVHVKNTNSVAINSDGFSLIACARFDSNLRVTLDIPCIG